MSGSAWYLEVHFSSPQNLLLGGYERRLDSLVGSPEDVPDNIVLKTFQNTLLHFISPSCFVCVWFVSHFIRSLPQIVDQFLVVASPFIIRAFQSIVSVPPYLTKNAESMFQFVFSTVCIFQMNRPFPRRYWPFECDRIFFEKCLELCAIFRELSFSWGHCG